MDGVLQDGQAGLARGIGSVRTEVVLGTLMLRRALRSVAHAGRLLAYPEYRNFHRHARELRRTPPKTNCYTGLLGTPLELVDAPGFLALYETIIGRQIYGFCSEREEPVIIDGGANIGLATIFFKRLHPNAKVVAVEADPIIVEVLRRNIARFDLTKVEIVAGALAARDGMISFNREGGEAGRIGEVPIGTRTTVRAVRLPSLLNQTIDLLKLDIEGAEGEVLEDCADKLRSVKNIFVEYHSFPNQPQQLPRILQILADAGFRFYIEAAQEQPKRPFIEKNTYLGMDLQLNIFGCRASA